MGVESELHFDEAIGSVIAATDRGMKQAAEQELEHVQENWNSDQNALGQPWQELAERTIREKGHSSILYEHGDLRSSGYVRRTGLLSVVLGWSDPKAAIHEYGTERIPARKFAGPAKVHLEQEVLMSELAEEIAKTVALLRFRYGF